MQPEKPCLAAGLADNDDDTQVRRQMMGPRVRQGSPGHTPESRVARGQWRKKPGIHWDQLPQRSSANEN